MGGGCLLRFLACCVMLFLRKQYVKYIMLMCQIQKLYWCWWRANQVNNRGSAPPRIPRTASHSRRHAQVPRASALAAPGQGSDDVASTSAQVFAQGGFDSRDSRASDGDVTAVKTSAGALSTTRSEADRSATRRATTSPSQSSWPTSRRRPRVTTAAACSCTTSSPSRPRSRLCRRSFGTSSTRATPSTCSPRQAAATTSRKAGAASRRACV